MKPCKIQVFDYFRPSGPYGDEWLFGGRYQPEDGEYALLCDSEEHADRILAALHEIERNKTEVKP